MAQTKIKCPNCGFDFNADEVFFHQAEERAKKQYEAKLSEQLEGINQKKEDINKELLKIKRLKEDQDDIIRRKLEEEKKRIAEEALFKAKKDVEFEMLKIKQDFDIKTKENLQLKKKEVEILNKEREIREKQDQLEIDVEKKMLEREKDIQVRAIRREQEKNELKNREHHKELELQKKLLEDMMKKESEMRSNELELRNKMEHEKEESEKLLFQKIRETEEQVSRREQERSSVEIREYENMLREQKKLIEDFNIKEAEMRSLQKKLKESEEQLKAEMERKMTDKDRQMKESEEYLKAEMEQKINDKVNQMKVNEDSLRLEMEREILDRDRKLKDKEEELKHEMQKKLLDKEREMLDRETEIEEKALIREKEKLELKMKEKDKMLDDQKKLMDEMTRKYEQGSQQMQGEIQELALEEFMKKEFPFDKIMEVKKGAQGADVIHIVRNNLMQECGKIIYESKRTKTFSDTWIEKLKEDQKAQNAEIAVIVTETMPRDMTRFGLKQGIWVCSFQEIKSLAFVLREMLITTHSVKITQVNKGGKMELLYGYMTSNEFRQQVEAIVEGFSGMKTDLEREKLAMQRIWKSREKQIEKVISNTIDMYGSIKGLAGSDVGTVKALELPEPPEELF